MNKLEQEIMKAIESTEWRADFKIAIPEAVAKAVMPFIEKAYDHNIERVSEIFRVYKSGFTLSTQKKMEELISDLKSGKKQWLSENIGE